MVGVVKEVIECALELDCVVRVLGVSALNVCARVVVAVGRSDLSTKDLGGVRCCKLVPHQLVVLFLSLLFISRYRPVVAHVRTHYVFVFEERKNGALGRRVEISRVNPGNAALVFLAVLLDEVDAALQAVECLSKLHVVEGRVVVSMRCAYDEALLGLLVLEKKEHCLVVFSE